MAPIPAFGRAHVAGSRGAGTLAFDTDLEDGFTEEAAEEISSDSETATSALGVGRKLSEKVKKRVWNPAGKSLLLVLLWLFLGNLGLTFSVDKSVEVYGVDKIYLLAQIITTVGYGDLGGPKSNKGYAFFSMYVLSSCLMIAQIVGSCVNRMVEGKPAEDSQLSGLRAHFGARFISMAKALLTWLSFVATWATFFVWFPGEEKAVGEAIYMGVITLTTVGFGDIVPVTRGGKLFAAVWMVLGTGAFTLMIGKFGIWTFFVFNKMSVEKLDAKALGRMTHTGQFQKVASARTHMIEELLHGFQFEKYREVSKAFAEKISRNDFLIFMILDMGLVDMDMIDTLSSHFDWLDATGEGYIDKEDLKKAIEMEASQAAARV